MQELKHQYLIEGFQSVEFLIKVFQHTAIFSFRVSNLEERSSGTLRRDNQGYNLTEKSARNNRPIQ